jgi:hypothetical protein
MNLSKILAQLRKLMVSDIMPTILESINPKL